MPQYAKMPLFTDVAREGTPVDDRERAAAGNVHRAAAGERAVAGRSCRRCQERSHAPLLVSVPWFVSVQPPETSSVPLLAIFSVLPGATTIAPKVSEPP